MKQKKRLSRRFMALLLTAVLVLGSLSLSAFAETSGDTAEAASEGTSAAADTDDDTGSEYIGSSSYYYQSVSFVDDDVSTYTSSNTYDYSWSTSATSEYYEMSGYYYLSSSDYYQVYYKVELDSEGTITAVTLYYTTDGTSYSTIGTVSSDTSITLYKAYSSFSATYDDLNTAINGTEEEEDSSDLEILNGYYYVSGDTLYYVYYVYTAATNTSSESIALYYSSSGSETSADSCTLIGTLTDGSTTSYTLYTAFETNISAYSSSAQVFWDLDDSGGSDNDYDGDDGDSSYITSVTLSNTYNSSTNNVTFGESTDTTNYEAGTSSDECEWQTPDGGLTLSSVYVDSDGNAVADATTATSASTLSITPAEGYYVSEVTIVCAPYVGSGSSSEGGDDSNGPGGNGGGPGGNTEGPDDGRTTTASGSSVSLSTASEESVAVAADEAETESGDASADATETESEAVTANKTKTAAASEDDLTTAANATTGRLSPYQCSTYISGNAYEGTFTLSSSEATGDSTYTLSIEISNEYFAHTGALRSSSTTPVYFILIKVAAIPTPAYVEYDYGEIVDYISSYNSANDLASSGNEGYVDSSIFTTNADGWTDTYTVSTTDEDGSTTTSDGNVYTDNASTTGGIMNGGVLTDDTQYEYVYDTSGTIKTSNWKHYANSITKSAIEAAAKAGYVFAGWAVTWYEGAAVSTTESTLDYNHYTITFSNALYTSVVTEGESVNIVGHVRLVAQWVKADEITQVIDYGLPVSTNVAGENEDDLVIEAITSNVTSRTSSDTDYSSATTTTLSTAISGVKYAVTTTTTSTDEDGNETTSSSTNYQTSATGAYGAFSVDSTDSGTAVYTLSEQMTGVESITYQVTLSYVSGSGSSTSETKLCTPTGTISIVPATSMYYEESFGVETSTEESGNTTTTYNFITYTNGRSTSTDEDGNTETKTSTWTSTGTALTSYQETGIVGTEGDSTYGTDAVYLNELEDSYGTSMYVDTTNASATFTYTFTGTGTTIYARTSTDSAYIGVFTYGEYDETNKTYSYYHGEYIDTRVIQDTSTYSSGNSTTLYGIPVYNCTDLDYGTYTVYVVVYMADTYVDGWYTEDGDGNKTKVSGSDESGADFYLDGIRIYNPIDPDEENETGVNDTYESVANVYEADGEDNMFLINVYEQLAMQEDGESASSGFVTITDTNGNITEYDNYFDIGPNNEVYLWNSSSSTDGETEETSTTSYSVTFYVLYSSGDDNDSDSESVDTDFDIYIGMKSPLGSASSVTIGSNSTATTLNNSPDCYYEVTGTSSTLTVGTGSVSAMKVTITGMSGLAALSYIKVVGSEDVEAGYNVDIDADDELTTELETDTVYLVSVASYEALLSIADTGEEDENDSDSDDEEEDGDDDQTDPEDEDEDDKDTNPEDGDDTEEESVTVFTPEKFEASISYLKLLKYASITVKASSDVSYITVNGEKVTGRTIFGTTYYTYSASRVSSGTTYEVVAYSADGTASETITLTAK